VTNSRKRYQNEDEIEAIVQGFEGCTLPDAEFKHAEHLTVALSYLHRLRLTVPEAMTRMREALYRFLDHYAGNRQAYHETITLFWIKLVNSFLDTADTARPVTDLANELIESYGNSNFIYDYYSREHLLVGEAKKVWVEPDLKPLDF
jgi:hypothetical protein